MSATLRQRNRPCNAGFLFEIFRSIGFKNKLRLHSVQIQAYLDRTNRQTRPSWLVWKHATKLTSCRHKQTAKVTQRAQEGRWLGESEVFYEIMTLKLLELGQWWQVIWHLDCGKCLVLTLAHPDAALAAINAVLTIPVKAIAQHYFHAFVCPSRLYKTTKWCCFFIIMLKFGRLNTEWKG